MEGKPSLECEFSEPTVCGWYQEDGGIVKWSRAKGSQFIKYRKISWHFRGYEEI